MAYSLELPARNKAHRIRMALALDAEPDFSAAKLLAWCGSNLSKDEMLGLVDSLRKLAAEAEDDNAETDKDARNRDYLNGLGEDSRRRGHISTAKAEAEFSAMFPDAGRLKQSL